MDGTTPIQPEPLAVRVLRAKLADHREQASHVREAADAMLARADRLDAECRELGLAIAALALPVRHKTETVAQIDHIALTAGTPYERGPVLNGFGEITGFEGAIAHG